jgi:stage II sporulation protein AA (anti-sigma F factor antagonist)
VYDVQHIEDTLIVRPEGEFDVHTAPVFRQDVEHSLEATRARKLIVSLKSVSFIDSSGLGVLLGRHRRMVELGGRMAIVSVPARIRPMLELSGLFKVIPLFDSEKKALERM